MEEMLILPPLHIFIQTEALATLSRILRHQPIKDTDHSHIWLEYINKEPILSMPTDRIITEFKFDKNFDIHIPPKEDWFNGIFPPEHEIVLYSDGSLIRDSAGAGLYCDKLNVQRSIPLGNYASIFLAEIRAIIEGCHAIKESNITNEIVFICSDSQAALKALSSVEMKSALTLECWELLNNLASDNRIDLLWVPAHSNIDGNEKADELAKKGALSKFIGPEPVIGTPYSNIRRKITTLRSKMFVSHWNNLPSCRQAKNCIKIDKKTSKFLLNVSRTRLKKYVGTVTGHFGFNNHLTTIGKRTDPSCECGEHRETAEHFLCYCPAFITARRKHLGGYTIRYNLIRSLQPKDILNYITSTGRFETTANV